MSYELWTLTPDWQMDRQIARDIDDYEDAEDMAIEEASERDKAILITRDGDGSDLNIAYPL